MKVKCSPSTAHVDDNNENLCADQCAPDPDDRILKTAVAEVIDYQRFCFYECKPERGPTSPPGSQCVSLAEADLEVLGDREGNAADPAKLFVARPAKRTALVAAPAGAPAGAQSPGPTESPEYVAKKGWAQARLKAVGARTQAAAGREVEQQAASELNGRLRAQGLIVDPTHEPDDSSISAGPYATIADIHEAMIKTGQAAEGAAELAQRAVAAVHRARKRSWKAALDEGQASMVRVREEAEAKAKADAALAERLTNRNEIKAAAAAAKAVQPYFLSMLRAQQTAKDYRARAESVASEAMALDSKAKSLAKEANMENQAGHSAVAQTDILSAREVASEAQALAKQARGMFTTAKAIDATIPKYQAAAQSAAAHAAWAANPAWNPGANTR